MQRAAIDSSSDAKRRPTSPLRVTISLPPRNQGAQPVAQQLRRALAIDRPAAALSHRAASQSSRPAREFHAQHAA
ncbi:hypothetical protein F511_41847 [Dorcoceras hygrometricum]|uniref:Uncharacterized protein n=1 Tax=Dorcoceras hygrometricum TaxID=472368 RepID=A0A2Z7C368_9LAMI|nr:hypothetical protein F511_41847 [Dorcoceras hygrometricum]